MILNVFAISCTKPFYFLFQLFVTAGPVSFLAFCFVIVIVASCLYVVFMKFGKDTERYKGISRK